MNNILTRVHELIKISDRQEIVKALQNLEKYILSNYQMRIFDNIVHMKEIEIYYKNEGIGYIDTTMHGRERQKNNFNNLYLHGAGIDICLSDSEDFYLSILIRGGYVVGKDNCKAYKHGPILLYDAVIPKKANVDNQPPILEYYCPLKADGGKTVCLEHLLFGVRGCFFNSKPPSVKEREARR